MRLLTPLLGSLLTLACATASTTRSQTASMMLAVDGGAPSREGENARDDKNTTIVAPQRTRTTQIAENTYVITSPPTTQPAPGPPQPRLDFSKLHHVTEAAQNGAKYPAPEGEPIDPELLAGLVNELCRWECPQSAASRLEVRGELRQDLQEALSRFGAPADELERTGLQRVARQVVGVTTKAGVVIEVRDQTYATVNVRDERKCPPCPQGAPCLACGPAVRQGRVTVEFRVRWQLESLTTGRVLEEVRFRPNVRSQRPAFSDEVTP